MTSQQQVATVLAFLRAHPDGMSTRAIEAHLSESYYRVRSVSYLIGLARYRYGDDVILTMKGGGYRLAHALREVEEFSKDRAGAAHRHLDKTVQTIDRGVNKFPDEDATEVQAIKAHLTGAMALIDSVEERSSN